MGDVIEFKPKKLDRCPCGWWIPEKVGLDIEGLGLELTFAEVRFKCPSCGQGFKVKMIDHGSG